jgi:hypothetical protein
MTRGQRTEFSASDFRDYLELHKEMNRLVIEEAVKEGMEIVAAFQAGTLSPRQAYIKRQQFEDRWPLDALNHMLPRQGKYSSVAKQIEDAAYLKIFGLHPTTGEIGEERVIRGRPRTKQDLSR